MDVSSPTHPSIIWGFAKGSLSQRQPCAPLAVAEGSRGSWGRSSPSLLGELVGWQQGLPVETSIVFPPVRVTKGQMEFHEMLLKNEKGLASGPRPRVPNPPQAEFYD